MRNELTPADKLAYEQLISSAADQVPHTVCGTPKLEELPKLECEDIALVCRSFPIDVNDNIEIDYAACAGDLVSERFCQLGVHFAGMLERACRLAIAYDVMCELEERERYAQIERDTDRHMRGLSPQSLS
jgi:hypothetical protein